MAPLEQPQVADRSDLSQRLDMPQVDLPPEESSVNLTQLVPELDLLGDKGKEKKDDSDEEEVRVENSSLKRLQYSEMFTVNSTCWSVWLKRIKSF